MPSNKCLIIGSTGHRSAHCVDWTTPPSQFPNIVDFDICIIDVQSLTVSKVKRGFLLELRERVARFFTAGGQLIVLWEREVTGVGADGKSVGNWSWCPHGIQVQMENGAYVDADKAGAFGGYLARLKKSSFYISNVSPNGTPPAAAPEVHA